MADQDEKISALPGVTNVELTATDVFAIVNGLKTKGLPVSEADKRFLTQALLTAKGDIFVRSATGIQKLIIGADGTTLTADSAEALGIKWGTGSSYSGYGSAGYDPFKAGGSVEWIDDFLADKIVSSFGNLGWGFSAAAGGNIAAQTGVAGAYGIMEIKSATTAGANTAITLHSTSMLCGADALTLLWKGRVGVVPTGAEETRGGWGMTNNNNIPFATDGVYFNMLQSVSAVNYVATTENGGVLTQTDTGVAMDTAFHVFRFEANADWTEVEFFIDGASVATHTTNIPKGKTLTPITSCYNGAGTLNKFIYVDTFYMRLVNTLARGAF